MRFLKFKSNFTNRIDRNYLRDHIGLAGVHISINLLKDIIHRAREYPYDEEGGVLVGRIHHDTWDYYEYFQKSLPVMHVYDFIPSGPRTQRTSVSLHSDLEFQEYEFERLTEIDPQVQHLGTWHSHHCNGIDHLSQGDLRSYFNILESPNHAHDYYLAILLHRLPIMPFHRFEDIIQYFKFYLLSRQKGRNCFELDSSCVEIVDILSPYDDIINPGYSLPDELFQREQTRNSWFNQSQAKAIIKADTLILGEYVKDLIFLSGDSTVTVKGIQGFMLVRKYRIGSLHLEYCYPEVCSDEGIKFRVGYQEFPESDLSYILEVRARPLEVRHQILSIILECFTPRKMKYYHQTARLLQEVASHERIPTGGQT